MRTIILVGALLCFVAPPCMAQTTSDPCAAVKPAEDRMTRIMNREADGEYVNQDAAFAASIAYVLAKHFCEHPEALSAQPKQRESSADMGTDADKAKLDALIEQNVPAPKPYVAPPANNLTHTYRDLAELCDAGSDKACDGRDSLFQTLKKQGYCASVNDAAVMVPCPK